MYNLRFSVLESIRLHYYRVMQKFTSSTTFFFKKCPQVKYIIQYNAVFSLDLFYFISNNNNYCVFTTTVYKTCEMSFKKTGSKFRDTCLLCNNKVESRWVWRWFKNPIFLSACGQNLHKYHPHIQIPLHQYHCHTSLKTFSLFLKQTSKIYVNISGICHHFLPLTSVCDYQLKYENFLIGT